MKRLLFGLLLVVAMSLPGLSQAQDSSQAQVRVINLYHDSAGTLTIGDQSIDIEPAPSATDYVRFDESTSGYSLQFGGSVRGSSAQFEPGREYLILVIAEDEERGTEILIDEAVFTSIFPPDQAQLQVLHYVTGLDNGRYTLQGDDAQLGWYQQAAFGPFDPGYPVKAMSLPAGDYVLSAEGLLNETALTLNPAELNTVVVSGQYPDNVTAVVVQGITVTPLEPTSDTMESNAPDTIIAQMSAFNITEAAQMDTQFGDGTHSLGYAEWGTAVEYDVTSGQPPSVTFVRENGFTGSSPAASYTAGHDYLFIGVDEPAQSDTLTATQTVAVLDLTYLLGPSDENTTGLAVINLTTIPDTISLLNENGDLLARQYLSAEFGFGVDVDNAIMAYHLTPGNYVVEGVMGSVDVNLVDGQNTIIVIGPTDTFVIQDGVVQ